MFENYYQATVDCLAVSLLHLPQLGDEVPEAGLGHHMVWGKDPHAIQRRSRVLGRGQEAPNDLVFLKLEMDRNRTNHILASVLVITCRPNNIQGDVKMLDLEFTFKGTDASEKGDKVHSFISAHQARSCHSFWHNLWV